MTLEEAIVEVYEATDEQSDWSPYSGSSVSLTTAGALRIAKQLERAQNAVAVWKFPNGRRIRFRFLRDAAFLQFTTEAAHEVDSGGTYPGFVLPMVFSPSKTADELRDRVFFFDDNAYPIVSNTTAAATVAVEVEADLGGELPLLTGPYWALTLPGSKKLVQVIGVRDVAEDVVLERKELQPDFLTKGRPAAYMPTPTGLVFDVCPEEDIYYRVAFQRLPVMPTTLAGTFEVPEVFHDALCEYAKYTANMRIGKAENAQMAWARCQTIMASIRQEDDLEDDVVDSRIIVSDL